MVPQLKELKENPLNLQLDFLPNDFLFPMSRFKKSASISSLVGEYIIVFFEASCSFGNSSKSDLSLISAPEKQYLSKFRTLEQRQEINMSRHSLTHIKVVLWKESSVG